MDSQQDKERVITRDRFNCQPARVSEREKESKHERQIRLAVSMKERERARESARNHETYEMDSKIETNHERHMT
jgi:hypothetical protein